MELLILIDSLGCGGAEKSLVSLMPFLVERGYDVTLMLRARGGLFEQYVPNGVNIVDFPYKPTKLQKLRYSLALRMPWNKNRHSAEIYWQCIGQHYPKLDKKYDVAISYQQGFPTFYNAEKVNASKKISWVNADIKSVGYSAKFCRPFYKIINHICGVSDILSNSIIFPEYVSKRNKITTVLDIQNENMIRSMANASNPYGEGIHIATVGRLVPLKGYDLAIEAARIMRNAGRKFCWHFVGGGTMIESLKAKINHEGLNDYVILEGNN